eukprot:TRINITY_DN18389_c0_g1_i2.p1 TRINITY_DN18389_c0_g1~~TRINITY_DN18389_c0_g1_i2.p1  ORF type:complete len:586 (+),score=156.25 TRINITY_DN18389_c0_g1_i2:126-1883(+)
MSGRSGGRARAAVALLAAAVALVCGLRRTLWQSHAPGVALTLPGHHALPSQRQPQHDRSISRHRASPGRLVRLRRLAVATEVEGNYAAIASHAAARQWQQALLDLRSLEESARSVEMYELVMRSLPGLLRTKKRSAERSAIYLQLALEMEDVLEKDRKDAIPSEETLVQAMQTYSFGGLWQRSIALLREMRDLRAPAREASYAAAMGSCISAGEAEKAADLMEEAAERSIQPNLNMYRAALAAAECLGEDQEALRLVQEMREAYIAPDPIAYGCAIGALQTQLQRAEKDTEVLSNWTEATCRMLLDESEAVLRRRRDSSVTAGRHNSLLVSEAWRGCSLYGSVIASCAKIGGLWERALELLDEAESELELGEEGSEVRAAQADEVARLRSAAAWACARSDRGNETLLIAEDMLRRSLPLDDVATAAGSHQAMKRDDVRTLKSLLQAHLGWGGRPFLQSREVDTVHLSNDAALYACRLSLARYRQQKRAGLRDWVILTPKSEEDDAGFDSLKKKLIYVMLVKEYGIDADYFRPGLIYVSKESLVKLNREFKGEVEEADAKKPKKRKVSLAKRKQGLVWKPPDEDED